MNSRAAIVSKLYDEKAQEYDSHFRRPIDRAEDSALYGRVRRYLDDLSVLDVGCGTGVLLDHARPRRWVGTDISSGMAERAILRAAWSETSARISAPMDFSTLTERDLVGLGWRGAFDTAISLWAFSYMPNARTAMINMARCVRPGGTVIVHVYDARYPEREHYVLNGTAADVVSPWTSSGLRALAGIAGLRVQDVVGFRYRADAARQDRIPVWAMTALMRAGMLFLPSDMALTRLLIARKPGG